MKVSLDVSVTARPEEHGHDLDAIVRRCELGQHTWQIDDLDELLASEWMKGKAAWDKQARYAEKVFTDLIYAPRRTGLWLLVTQAPAPVGSSTQRYCVPKEARTILEEPAYLVVENKGSDGAFLRAIARVYSRERVVHALDQGWLEPASGGGGGEVKKEVLRLLGSPNPVAPWRVMAVLDSDRLIPGTLPDKVSKLQQELMGLGVAVWVLFKREIENYLPYSLLDSPRRHEVYVSFMQLTREQQDHYDMKEGFTKKKGAQGVEVPAEQDHLFKQVSDWHRTRLRRGFGDDIGSRFGQASLDREELDTVCSSNPGELERLLDALESIL